MFRKLVFYGTMYLDRGEKYVFKKSIFLAVYHCVRNTELSKRIMLT